MSIYNSMNVGVNGVKAQSTRIAVISDNIANSSTVGYKPSEAGFRDLLSYSSGLPDGGIGVYSANGASAGTRTLIGAQGPIIASGSETDLGIAGNGFFVVSESAAGAADLRYTRAGAFSPDANGDFRNKAGYVLKAWRLDNSGALPPALTAAPLAASTAFAELETVNVAAISDIPTPTTEVSVIANLNAAQTAYNPLLYNAADSMMNMAGGTVPPHFNRAFDMVDSLGNVHPFMMSFLKTATGSWAVEVYAQTPGALTGSADGQVARGTVTFNGDGTLQTVSPALTGPVTIPWSGAAAPGSVTFDYGTAGPIFGTPGATLVGRSDGLGQFDNSYELRALERNGSAAGSLTGVTVDTEGYVIGRYSNNTSRALFKIPLAQFRDPSRLSVLNGNVYGQTVDSAEPSFTGLNQSGYGRILARSLEQSSVVLEKQLTELIIAQRAYQANTSTINTTDAMLRKLDDMLR